jgi:hypothetical protein
VIVWRGLDPHFVQDFIEHLQPAINLSVCNGRAGQGDVAITKLREGGLEMAHNSTWTQDSRELECSSTRLVERYVAGAVTPADPSPSRSANGRH